MDLTIIKEINVELQVVLGTFKNCFSETNFSDFETNELFLDAVNKIGWINIDHLKIDELMHIIEHNHNKARQIKDFNKKAILIKAINSFMTIMFLYWKKGNKMDKAGCGDFLCANLASMNNICYFIEKRLVFNEDVQLVYLNNIEQTHFIYTKNIITNIIEDYVVGFIFLVALNKRIIVEVLSLFREKFKYSVELYLPHDIQTVNFKEEIGYISNELDITDWKDELFVS